ncbi:MAG: methylmalonyl Co-A mutase-associated GTPase MeaB [Deltaproteobacteria bacterium]|nr:methylmalonyl Co-A mutase-associated GTPase MeaB [Deltaproteobacteria bacterium]MBI3295222.1 methylmalonyl Co-A mutase-associated GTPase MeaB [Deltaproteobacteria bacterium]
MSLGALEKPLLAGDGRALAKWISAAENRDPAVWELLARQYDRLGKASVLGVTGPPGAGKSTLIGLLVERLRKEGQKVGVLAVDPISPFSDGALLGDRIRLSNHFNDMGVFIRSVSTRGRLGGLSIATREAVHLMDLAGFDSILLETVGVGQSEVDVRRIADATMVVLVPESGDGIQVLKAGVLEIGDVLVVNKSDRERASELTLALKEMVSLSKRPQVPVVGTSQGDVKSIDDLFLVIQNQLTRLKAARRADRGAFERTELVESWVLGEVRRWLGTVVEDAANPYDFAMRFIKAWTPPRWK